VSIVCASARGNTTSRYWSISIGEQGAFVSKGDTTGADVTAIVTVDWIISALVGENSGVSVTLGYSVRVTRGVVFDVGWAKTGIAVESGLDGPQADKNKVSIANIRYCK
jgi:hypothetical protein